MRNRFAAVLFLTFLYLSCHAGAQSLPAPVASSDSKAAIEHVLHTQQDAWNRHDLDAFMAGYWKSPELTFFSGVKEQNGWQGTLDRYKKNYNTREKMGTLTFSDLEITLPGKESALVLGRWHLKRASDEPHGRFTLVFRKTKQGWKIIHDHTSSA